ncbi:hypothetical protein [Thermococcus stetteri]|uniref:hypothetical protein n=1 Tax=Thermococcus stetteri TaxID=49900 RepID=UPI001AE6D4E4|nr:hypothetical protein [Thermococcus stetteri]MBP1912713.1 hypothetical protein [Thermococcus stetteri]
MLVKREKAILIIITLIFLSGCALFLLHERTLPSPGPYKGIDLGIEVFNVSAQNLSSILGNYTPVAYCHKRLDSHVAVDLEYHAVAIRNVGCDQFQIRGRLTLLIVPHGDSIAIRKVLIILENNTDVTVNSVFPMTGGMLYVKTRDGTFEMMPASLPGYTPRQAMVIRALKPSWGLPLEAEPYVDLEVEKHGREKEVEGQTRLIIRVEYLSRTGFFTSQDETLEVTVPMSYLITDLDSCAYP